MILLVLAESVRWHGANIATHSVDAVLNICRSLRYAEEGVWVSKQGGGEWMLERLGGSEVVAAALTGYGTSAEIAADDARVFARLVAERVDEILHSLSGEGS
jgi:hypothetical protein